MKPVLLTDFGSTYTKLTAVDLDAAKLLGTAQAYTTVASDVRIGFQKALDALLAQTGPLTFAQSYACSSAAGGLRMMVSGLVPELTMEAARLASLGAGAKIVGQFSFELTQDDLVYTHHVRATDIDMGRHMNNVVYIRLLLDCFSAKELASGRIKSIEAHYASPCLEGETLGVFCRRKERLCRMAVRHADGRPAVLAQIVFR